MQPQSCQFEYRSRVDAAPLTSSNGPMTALRSGRSSNAIGTKSSARVQPIIIGCKAPKFLKSLSGNLADFGPQGDPNLDAGRG